MTRLMSLVIAGCLVVVLISSLDSGNQDPASTDITKDTTITQTSAQQTVADTASLQGAAEQEPIAQSTQPQRPMIDEQKIARNEKLLEADILASFDDSPVSESQEYEAAEDVTQHPNTASVTPSKDTRVYSENQDWDVTAQTQNDFAALDNLLDN